jgi:hypothetical protein
VFVHLVYGALLKTGSWLAKKLLISAQTEEDSNKVVIWQYNSILVKTTITYYYNYTTVPRGSEL